VGFHALGTGQDQDRTEMIIDEYADRWAFLVKNLKLELPAGSGATAQSQE